MASANNVSAQKKGKTIIVEEVDEKPTSENYKLIEITEEEKEFEENETENLERQLK